MITNYTEAVDATTKFYNQISEMDRALCRKGGHPDDAQNVTDRFLLEKLIQVQRAVLSLQYTLLEKEHQEARRKEKEEDDKPRGL